jgi:hypothetical protein
MLQDYSGPEAKKKKKKKKRKHQRGYHFSCLFFWVFLLFFGKGARGGELKEQISQMKIKLTINLTIISHAILSQEKTRVQLMQNVARVNWVL